MSRSNVSHQSNIASTPLNVPSGHLKIILLLYLPLSILTTHSPSGTNYCTNLFSRWTWYTLPESIPCCRPKRLFLVLTIIIILLLHHWEPTLLKTRLPTHGLLLVPADVLVGILTVHWKIIVVSRCIFQIHFTNVTFSKLISSLNKFLSLRQQTTIIFAKPQKICFTFFKTRDHHIFSTHFPLVRQF